MTAPSSTEQQKPENQKIRTFTFDEPEPVASRLFADSLGVFPSDNGEIYLPPVPRAALARLLRANAHHGTIPGFKRNLILRDFVPSRGLSWLDMRKAALDFNVFGEAYFQIEVNWLGEVLALRHLMAINMRRKTEKDGGGYRMLVKNGHHHDFAEDEIVHVYEYGVEQDIYGVPDYLGGLQSLLLNESATLFRRRYYENGAHVGYVFYVSDPDMTDEDEQEIKAQLAQAKGPGNFRSMFINIPDGKEKSVQILPVGDFSTKDEMAAIKNLTRNDIIAAWRMNPALAGVIPENAGGFGDLEKIDRIYTDNEIRPICQLFLQVNDYLRPDRQIDFKNLGG